MTGIGAAFRRLRRYLTEAELISAGAVVAAATGETVLAYQLEQVRAQAVEAVRDPHLHRRVGRLEPT